MIRKTYAIDDEDKILICEETYDTNNNLIHQKDYKNIPSSERKFEYNEVNQLMLEFEIIDGKIFSRIEYMYNKEGEVCDRKTFFNDLIFEHIIQEKSENGFIKTTIQDGVEVERLEKNISNRNWKNHFWINNQIVEIREYTYDEVSRIGTALYQDFENDVRSKIIEHFNHKGELIMIKEFKDEDQLVSETLFLYDKDLLITESTKDYTTGDVFEYRYEYDLKKNRVKTECYNSKNKLITFHRISYDHKNRIISECGNSSEFFNFIYEYE